MPSKDEPLLAEMEELVAAIKHNLHLKSKRLSRRPTPYSVRADKGAPTDDPLEILTYLRKGILISEAVKRLRDCPPAKDRDFYADENAPPVCEKCTYH